MPQCAASTHRFDPTGRFRYRVIWDGKPVSGFSEVSALKPTTEAMSQRDGDALGRGRTSPEGTGYEAVTLERGVAHDPEFEAWANEGSAASTLNVRRDIVIGIRIEAGRFASAFEVRRCRVAEYRALPERAGEGNAVGIEMMKLDHEGWERLEDPSELA